MFGFLSRRRRDAVRAVLAGHMNRFFARQLRVESRQARRGMFCQVVWVIPYDDGGGPGFDRAYPVVTRDLSPEGIGILDTRPVNDERIVVGIEADVSTQFVVCCVQHCTSLGYGFYQIGLKPTEVVDVGPDAIRQLEERREQFGPPPPVAAKAEASITA